MTKQKLIGSGVVHACTTRRRGVCCVACCRVLLPALKMSRVQLMSSIVLYVYLVT